TNGPAGSTRAFGMARVPPHEKSRVTAHAAFRFDTILHRCGINGRCRRRCCLCHLFSCGALVSAADDCLGLRSTSGAAAAARCPCAAEQDAVVRPWAGWAHWRDGRHPDAAVRSALAAHSVDSCAAVARPRAEPACWRDDRHACAAARSPARAKDSAHVHGANLRAEAAEAAGYLAAVVAPA